MDLGSAASQILVVLAKFYNSAFFAALKLLAAIYVTVLFADIVMLLILRGPRATAQVFLKGTAIPAISPKKMAKRWKVVKDMLASGDESQYKLAILKSDEIADKILAGISYKGAHMTERLEQAKPGQIENIEDLKRAHSIRNRVVSDSQFSVDRKTAEEVVGIYENFLKELEYL